MADWFDPLGMRRVGDAMSTGAAQALVNRPVHLDGRGVEGRTIDARVAAVHQAAPASSFSAMLAAQLGLWRRLDVTFDQIRIGEHTVESLRVDATDIRAIDALPQRIRAATLDVTVQLTSAEVAAWLAHAAPDDVAVRIVDRRILARLPGLARFGEVELEPSWAGRTVRIDVGRAWVRGRRINLPERFRRHHEHELRWLPPTTELQAVDLDERGGATVHGTIVDYEVELDVPRLLRELTARRTAGVIDVVLGAG